MARSDSITTAQGIDALADADAAMVLEPERPRRRRSRPVRFMMATGRTVRWSYRNRRRLSPPAAATALYIAGAAFQDAPDGWGGALMANAAIAAGVYGRWRWRRRANYYTRPAQWLARHGALPQRRANPMTRWELGRLLGSAGSAGALLQTAASADVPVGFYLAWLAATGVPWWWLRRIREIPEVEDELSREEVFNERLGGTGGRLYGATLAAAEDLPGLDGKAWGGTIVLSPGRQQYSDAKTATPMIASAYGLPISSVAVTQHPSGSANLASLKVYERNPLEDMPHWPGIASTFDPVSGIAHLGLHIDNAPALYRYHRPDWGTVHDLITGSTGSGKSELLRQLFAIDRHTGIYVSWGGDPQYGASFEYWQDHLDCFASGVDECMGLLVALREELHRRAEKSSIETWEDEDGDVYYGIGDFTPTAENPGLVVAIDEWQEVWQEYPEALDIAVDAAILGRKLGIKLRLASHLVGLEAIGTEQLRQPLVSGNVIALRNTSRMTQHMVNLPADPYDLPAAWPGSLLPTSGLGYLSGVEDRGAVFRSWRPLNRRQATRHAKTGNPPQFSREGAERIGPFYLEWRQRLASRRRGIILPVPGVTDLPEAPAAESEEIAGQALAVSTTKTAKGPQRGVAKAAILAFVRTQPTTTTALVAEATGCAKPTISTTLRRLAEEGLVIDYGHGEWGSVELREQMLTAVGQ